MIVLYMSILEPKGNIYQCYRLYKYKYIYTSAQFTQSKITTPPAYRKVISSHNSSSS